MSQYHDTRRVLAIRGAGAREFLQGLVTNDVAGLDQGLVYAALLTPQGKFIADFFLQADGSEDVLLDVAASHADDLLRRLTMYKLRSPVALEPTELKVSRGLGDAPSGALPDPRSAALGWRLISDDALADDDTDWDALHIANAIPRTGIDLTEDSYILEMAFERLNGVDFRKGCYVGQEIVARMKHKTELRKGLALVTVDGAASAEITADGKPAGTLLSRAGDLALAHLRFDRAQGPLAAGEAQVAFVGAAIEDVPETAA